MRTLRYILMVAGVMCGFRTGNAQILPGYRYAFIDAQASARSGVNYDLPPANSGTSYYFSVFGEFVTNSASVGSANSLSRASQFTDVQPYSITSTGGVFASGSVDTNLDETAYAIAQSVADINFDLTNRHAYSLQGTLSSSASTNATLWCWLYLYGPGTNEFSRTLPADAGPFSITGELPASSYRLLIEYRIGATANSGVDASTAAADFRVRFQVAPAPEFTSFERVTNGMRTTWASISGVFYQVQSADSLLMPSWTNTGPSVLATNGTTSAADTSTFPTSRFYRVFPFP